MYCRPTPLIARTATAPKIESSRTSTSSSQVPRKPCEFDMYGFSAAKTDPQSWRTDHGKPVRGMDYDVERFQFAVPQDNASGRVSIVSDEVIR